MVININTIDILSDFIVRIKNAQRAYLLEVTIPLTKLNKKIVVLLTNEGFLRGYKILNANKIIVLLSYIHNKPIIQDIQRISKPGNRVYMSLRSFKKYQVQQQNVFFVISNSNGIYSSKIPISGELLFKIYY